MATFGCLSVNLKGERLGPVWTERKIPRIILGMGGHPTYGHWLFVCQLSASLNFDENSE